MAGDYNDEYISLILNSFNIIRLSKFVTKGYACDGLDPVNELVHQCLAAGIALVTACLGPEGDDANLDPRPVRLPHNGRPPAVSEAGASSVGAAGAHHVLCHDPVQGITVLIGEDLHLNSPKTFSKVSISVYHPPAEDRGVLADNLKPLSVESGARGVAVGRGSPETGLSQGREAKRGDLTCEDDGVLQPQETDVVVQRAGDVAPHVVVRVDYFLLDLDELLTGADGEEAVIPHKDSKLLHGNGRHAVGSGQDPLLGDDGRPADMTPLGLTGPENSRHPWKLVLLCRVTSDNSIERRQIVLVSASPIPDPGVEGRGPALTAGGAHLHPSDGVLGGDHGVAWALHHL